MTLVSWLLVLVAPAAFPAVAFISRMIIIIIMISIINHQKHITMMIVIIIITIAFITLYNWRCPSVM